jgi:hypothetical protein
VATDLSDLEFGLSIDMGIARNVTLGGLAVAKKKATKKKAAKKKGMSLRLLKLTLAS